MQSLRYFLLVSMTIWLTFGCSKDYQVEAGELDPQSSEALSSGEVPQSGAVLSSGTPVSSGVVVSSSSGAVPSSSSVLVVDPDSLKWIGNPPVQITEIDPNNLTWTDHLGDDPGWVELYNPSAAAVNLKGYSFVENLTTPKKWIFGDVSIPAKSYRIIFCSDLNLPTPPTGPEDLGKNRAHTNWKLEKDGGTLYLLDSAMRIRDSLVYPSIPNGVSWGSLDSKWGFFTNITPEAANVAPQFAKISAPVAFTSGGGFFSGAQSIAIPSTGGTVRCTQDGSIPTESTPAVTGSLAISKTTVLRCASFETGAIRGPVTTQTFFIGEPSTSMPVIAISTDPVEMFDPDVGLYMPGPNVGGYGNSPDYKANFFQDRKVAVHVEYFGRDRQPKWHSDAGLNIVGNWSRMFPKKSVSIKFSENFGGSALNYPLFPSHLNLTKFKAIILRNGGNSFNVDFIRDPLMCTSTEGLGVDYQKSDYVQVYYNGSYYGIHNLREKLNEDYVKTNYDIDAQTVDVISVAGKDGKAVVEVSNGTADAYNEMMAYLSSSGSMEEEANYAKLKTMVDVENYANYVGSEIYFRNTDWPGNNVKMWRTHTPAGPFKFMLFDTDHGYGFPHADGDRGPSYDLFNLMECSSGCPGWPNPSWSTLLYRKLMQNPGWKTLFINRMAVMLSYWYTPSRMNKIITDLDGMVTPESKRDFDRWNDRDFVDHWYPDYQWERTTSNFAGEVEKMKTFANERPGYVRDHMRSHFDLGDDADVTLSWNGPGKIQVHGLALPTNPFKASFFSGYAVEITAVPLAGATFTSWSDGVKTVTRTIEPGLIGTVTANFQ